MKFMITDERLKGYHVQKKDKGSSQGDIREEMLTQESKAKKGFVELSKDTKDQSTTEHELILFATLQEVELIWNGL